VVAVELVRRLRERPDEPRIGQIAVGDEELECGQPLGDLREPHSGDGDLEILVLTPLLAEEEVDRPAGRDVPRRLHAGQPLGHLLRPPRVPECEVGLERPCCRCLLERHRSGWPGG